MFEKKSFFEGSNPKVIFLLGLFIGIAVISIIALLVLLFGGGSLSKEKEVNNNNNDTVAVRDSGVGPSVAPPSAADNKAANLEPVSDSDHIRGDKNAPVTIVEYSDFECPFCRSFHPTMQKVMSEYQGKVRWVYRHFPLTNIHPQALSAAEASECAAEQGKFWEFGDALFTNQDSLGDSLYKKTAEDLGLDMSKFNDCLTAGKYTSKVRDQASGGSAAGVRGTPASFINGQLVSGAVPYETLKSVIDGQL